MGAFLALGVFAAILSPARAADTTPATTTTTTTTTPTGTSAKDAVGKPNEYEETEPFPVYIRTIADKNSTAVIFKYNNLGIMINLFARILSVGAGVMFFFLILSAGYKLIFASNKTDALGRVRKQLTIGIIGLLVTISAYWVTQILLRMTNVDAFMQATNTVT